MPDVPTLTVCGLDCTACDIYRAAQDPAVAKQMAATWRANGQADARADWFTCQGCTGDRAHCWSDDCRLFACCTEKGYGTCGDCADFPCDVYDEWVGHWAHHRAARERLIALRSR